MHEEFINAVKAHQAVFKLDLSDKTVDLLANYYQLVQQHNPLLHLIGACSPEEFAVRHILESLTLLAFLPNGAMFADVGAGAGLPSIPCLLVRDDLRAILIESNLKKAGFLRTALTEFKLAKRAEVFDRQFSEMKGPRVPYVTCRALDKFTEKLPQMIRWAGNSTFLFFGGPSLKAALETIGIQANERLMPLSEQRFLFVGNTENRSDIQKSWS